MIACVIPAYNEEKKIKDVVLSVLKYVDLVVVVDDGSLDRTGIIASVNKVVLLRHEINLGQGAALETGLSYLRKSNVNVVVTFDADGQFVPAQIPKIVRPILDGKCDVTLGSRFIGKAINLPRSKRILLKLALLFTNIYSGLALTDTHNGFRAFNKKALKKIVITQNRFSHASEIIQLIKKNKLKYMEVPITVKYSSYSKQKGQKLTSSLNILYELTFKKLFNL